jgi:hypothetical protein
MFDFWMDLLQQTFELYMDGALKILLSHPKRKLNVKSGEVNRVICSAERLVPTHARSYIMCNG